MKSILHSNFSFDPIGISISYMENNQIYQKFADKILIFDYLNEYRTNKYLEVEDYFNELINHTENLLDLLEYISPKISYEEANQTLKDVDETLDIHDIPRDLQEFLKVIISDKNSTHNEVLAWSLFANRLQKNIDPYVRHQLFGFLSYLLKEGSIAISNEGTLVAYKGLDKDNLSIHSGTAYVNNEIYKDQQIPNNINDIISMPRNKVEANPDTPCSFGLHAGTFNYANSFGSKVILVEIAPEDIVSIPKDSDSQKLRCCKYRVLKEVDNFLKDNVVDIKDLLTTISNKGTPLTELSEEDVSGLNGKEEIKGTPLTELSEENISDLNKKQEFKGKPLTGLNQAEIEDLNNDPLVSFLANKK